MADLDDRLAKLSPAQRTRLQERLVSRAAAKLRAAAEASPAVDSSLPTPPSEPGEPIAIVGMACRFAGAPDVQAFWRMIRDGVEGVTEVPTDRWAIDEFHDPQGGPGKSVTRRGAFIEGIDLFEPTFFGVTPREAARMDPQQRLLLEVAWETLENAGCPADQMAGSATGVYVGVGGTDYMKLPVRDPDYYRIIDAHVGTGNALSIASNRVSYSLDLRGPSLSVDTACSSGSLAIHLAIESLRRGETNAALAGGANLIMAPDVTIAFSQSHMLSPEGRCRSYDAGASGYVRGEGCAFVLLKRLDDAQRDGDDIHGVLLGTAVNQDGRTPGIAAPSVLQQQACLRRALSDAGLSPHDIDYIEGHGTGTPLGDPIELQALAHVFGKRDDADRPLWLTSVKGNIGHTETVSGVAGLIKAVLLMEHETVPRQPFLEKLNPHVDLSDARVEPLTESREWPSQLAEGGRRRTAGVSSFGFGGTNTHFIVAEPPLRPEPKATPPERSIHVLKLAAKTADRIPEQARRLAGWLRSEDGSDATVADIASTMNTGRSDFPHRVAITAGSRSHLLATLDQVAAGDQHEAAGIARDRPQTAWLFTGQGSQRPGMGKALYACEPVFRRVLDRCDAVLAESLGDRLLDVMQADDDRINQTRHTQPALFAVECGLAALWKSWGVTPDAVLGHSIGEYAAAVTAGVLSLDDGARLVGERARLMHAAAGEGAMAVVFAPETVVADALAGREAALAIAAVNGPENVVVSGAADAVDQVLRELAERDVASKRLTVSHAFHSPLMNPVLDEFEQLAGSFEHHAAKVPMASNVTGDLITAESMPTDWGRYWRDHLRGTVRFAEGVAAAAKIGATHWIEVGPAPVLAGMAARCDVDFAGKPEWIASLRPGVDERESLAQAVANHWAGGSSINWRAWERGRVRRRLPLPNYPMRRERFWYENLQASGAGRVAQADADASPVLGGRLPMAAGAAVFEAPIDPRTPGWLADHQVDGSIVAPAAMFVEQALAAAATLGDRGDSLRVDGVTIRQALVPPSDGRLRLQTIVERESAGRRRLTIHAAPADESAPRWTEHAEATLVSAGAYEPIEVDLDGFDERVLIRQTRDEFYAAIGARGLSYGSAFRVLDGVRRSEYDATADLIPSKAVAAEFSRYRLHPAMGDALLQTIAAVLPLEEDGSFSPHTYLPVRIESVRLHRQPERGEPLRAVSVRRDPGPATAQPSPETVEADAVLLDGGGRPIAEMRGVVVKKLASQSAVPAAARDPATWLYQVEWNAAPIAATEPPPWPKGPTLVFADATGQANELAEEIEARGGSCVVVRPGKAYKSQVEETDTGTRTSVTIDPDDPDHYERLIGLIASNPSGKPAAVVHAWSLDAGDWPAAESLGVGSVMRLTQQLVRRGLKSALGTWFVTQSAHPIGEQPASPHAAAVAGFGRVAAMEHPELGVRLLDTDGPIPLPALLADDGENQIAYRGGERYTARLTKAESLAATLAPEGTPPPDAPSWRLGLRRTGSFDGLAYEPCERGAPGPGQVELELQAAGLNFSDVLKALGLYPGIQHETVPLGIEASGVVAAVGEGVEHLAVGDSALGVLPYAFASHATTAAYAVVPKPAGVSHDEGATIPIVFLTAHYALERLAQLQPGERVLIHAAAGGVGLAALQVAQHVGAEVFATAGSEEKRDLLRSLGVEHVYDSRSLDFAQQVRDATCGEGVDVVLNSLPGEAIDASLGLLRAYGRFCEIGKIDIYGDRKIGLLPFQDNLSYFAIDLDRLLRERPEQVRRLFTEVMQRFSEGAYRPLPITRFATERTPDAFRYMSQRKNIGKVVVSMRPEGAAEETGPVIQGGGYLITGGLGALGRRVARWLAQHGAGGVALLSRRAPDTEFLDALAGLGVEAVCLQGDVADRESLLSALSELPEGFPRLAGVIHAAGVLDDGLIADLDADRLSRVLRPKAVGSWNLHEATLDAGSPLARVEQFVLFSSVASVLGSPGQANYAAANAALDALASHRQAKGLPATSLAWGPWANDGLAGESGSGEGMAAGEVADAVRSKGMDLLPPEDALQAMGGLVQVAATNVAVFDARWEAMSKLLVGRETPFLAGLLTEAEVSAQGDSQLRARLIAAPADQRQAELVAMVRVELARVTSVAAEDIDLAAPLTAIGIDSLMALELKNNLEAKLAINLPMGKLLAGPSVVSLAEAAAEELIGEASGASTAASWSPLVTLREGREGVTPLFLMPVLGGDVGAYRDLAEAFETDQPVVALRPRGLDSDDPPHERLDDIAADYADAIRGAYPDLPIRLAGWSTGGITALAVSQRLEALGTFVESVGLFDTPPPSVYDEIDPTDDAAFLAIVVEFAARFTGVDAQPLANARLSELPESERFATVLEDAKRSGLVTNDVDEGYVRKLVAVGEALVVATRGYEPPTVAAPVAFFTPEVAGGFDGITDLPDPNISTWRTHFGDALNEHQVPGDHFTMIRGTGASAIAAALLGERSE